MLSRRLQVLLDEERWQRLEQQSSRTGASIGSIVRRALDDALPAPGGDAATAAAVLLDAEPMRVGDWAAQKREMLDELGPVDGA